MSPEKGTCRLEVKLPTPPPIPMSLLIPSWLGEELPVRAIGGSGGLRCTGQPEGRLRLSRHTGSVPRLASVSLQTALTKSLSSSVQIPRNIKPLTGIKMVTSFGLSSFFNFLSGCLQCGTLHRKMVAASALLSKQTASPRVINVQFQALTVSSRVWLTAFFWV